ncbi:GNAT superfamily N-acetyltransferase [Microbacterium resistens]|uniref:GNAT superfamily N-acetyltransferase n=1 Tax=Microbacterium resistens TaxID=156977 RepID=A0ABU1SFY9_9MICO|nr:GNAT family N-acetyltransferase [Microbacterium resistens]MDR6868487.1 GNAT superfamily N-acetyltransferase [Microbacterium resistens]
MTSVPPVVRRATLDDAGQIAEVHVASWRETYAGVIPDRLLGPETLTARHRMWSSILSLDPVPGTVVVAEREGRVIGFAFSGSSRHPDATRGIEPARDLHLFSLYLLAAEHGDGVGHALLEAALGNEPAQLWVLSANDRARAFYEQHQFCADGAEIVDPDLDGLVEIRMVR